MGWELLLDNDVRSFIEEHEGDDVADLALRKSPDKDWPYPIILDQIKTRQKARLKTPKLRDTKGFVFPPSFLYEQASSEACAAYKLLITNKFSGETFVDLTAGCGVDSFFLAKIFSHGVLVEKNSQNAVFLSHNCSVVKGALGGKPSLEVYEGEAKVYVRDELLAVGRKVSLIYIDPQRREDAGGKKGFFDFARCSPNILEILPGVENIAGCVLIKTAPFLDIDKAVKQISECFSNPPHIDVYVVQWRGECKEVLYLLDFSLSAGEKGAKIIAVDIDDDGLVKNEFDFYRCDEKEAAVDYAVPRIGDFIYEPGPAFLKAGGFKYMAKYFCMNKLHEHTHLYVSDREKENFPGKRYRICGVFPVKIKKLPIDSADVVVRNFPQSVSILRKKLKLRDGGDYRVYATTIYGDRHCLVLCNKNMFLY